MNKYDENEDIQIHIFVYFIKHILCTVYIILFPELLHL